MPFFINGNKVCLREVRATDVNDAYYEWLNNEKVNRFLETGFMRQGKELILSYVKEHTCKANEPFFAICLRDTDEHIGNIKLGPINYHHRTADISYFIGVEKC